MMELGNLVLGHSRGEHEVTNRNMINSRQWQELCKVAGVNDCYGYSNANSFGGNVGYENDTFVIRSYWWGEEDAPEAYLPNFLYKPTGFEIRWYKYALRDSYMNHPLSERKILKIFDECRKSIGGAKG